MLLCEESLLGQGHKQQELLIGGPVALFSYGHPITIAMVIVPIHNSCKKEKRQSNEKQRRPTRKKSHRLFMRPYFKCTAVLNMERIRFEFNGFCLHYFK